MRKRNCAIASAGDRHRGKLLVPGYGSQGGTTADVAAALDDHGRGAIVNNSRGIIFVHSRGEYARFGAAGWQDAVEAATREMIDQLRSAVRGLGSPRASAKMMNDERR